MSARPEGLLDTETSNPRTQAIEQANATKSPFLRLPSEIRNRIYKHAFGGHLIHVDNYPNRAERYAPQRPRLSICSAEQHEHEVVQEIRALNTFDGIRLFDFRHEPCRYHAGDGLAFWEVLELLRICRQVHRDAALLPYQLNTFHFYGGFRDVQRFTDALIPDQRCAIRSIGFFFSRFADLASRFYPDISILTGVKHLSILAQLDHKFDVEVLSRCKDSKEREDQGFSGLFHFFRAGFPLRSASVAICSVNEESPDQETLQNLRDWGARVEKKLLESEPSRVTRTSNRGGMVQTKKRGAEGDTGSGIGQTKKGRRG